MNHSIRFSITNTFPSIAKTVFFRKYQRAMKTGVLPRGWKESEIFFLPEILTADSVFFDVGANVGIYSYLASGYVKPDNIHSFEPMPNYFESLEKLFPQSHVNNIALSDKAGIAEFKIPAIQGKSFTARATLNTEFVEENEDSEKSMIFEVATQTLDEYCVQNSINRLDLIKIDVEGHEGNVLAGGMDVISRLKPTVMVEIEQRHHVDSISNTIDSVCALGYKCCFFDSASKVLVPITESIDNYQKLSDFGTASYINNFIFTPF